MSKYDFHFGNGNLKSPCTRECPDRFAGCVRTCEKYKTYEAEKLKKYAVKNNEVSKERALNDVEMRRKRSVCK